MWRRLNSRDRQVDGRLESQTLVNTSADQDSFQASTDIDNNDFSMSSRPAFGRKGTADVLKGLPAVPLYVKMLTLRTKIAKSGK